MVIIRQGIRRIPCNVYTVNNKTVHHWPQDNPCRCYFWVGQGCVKGTTANSHSQRFSSNTIKVRKTILHLDNSCSFTDRCCMPPTTVTVFLTTYYLLTVGGNSTHPTIQLGSNFTVICLLPKSLRNSSAGLLWSVRFRNGTNGTLTTQTNDAFFLARALKDNPLDDNVKYALEIKYMTRDLEGWYSCFTRLKSNRIASSRRVLLSVATTMGGTPIVSSSTYTSCSEEDSHSDYNSKSVAIVTVPVAVFSFTSGFLFAWLCFRKRRAENVPTCEVDLEIPPTEIPPSSTIKWKVCDAYFRYAQSQVSTNHTEGQNSPVTIGV